MTVSGARDRITEVALSWIGVTAAPHRFGGTEFLFGRREIGHIHGDHLVDIPFPTRIRDEIVAAGRAEPHHLLGESGWVSFYLRQPDDVDSAIELLRRSYEIAAGQRAKRASTS